MFWGLIASFIEVTEEKLVGGPFAPISISLKEYFLDWFKIALV